MAEPLRAGQIGNQRNHRHVRLAALAQSLVDQRMFVAKDNQRMALFAAADNAFRQLFRRGLRHQRTVQRQSAIAKAIRHVGEILRQAGEKARIVTAEKHFYLPRETALFRQNALQPGFPRGLQHLTRGFRRHAAAFVKHPINGCYAHANPFSQRLQRHAFHRFPHDGNPSKRLCRSV